jgi:hypothetical protein
MRATDGARSILIAVRLDSASSIKPHYSVVKVQKVELAAPTNQLSTLYVACQGLIRLESPKFIYTPVDFSKIGLCSVRQARFS